MNRKRERIPKEKKEEWRAAFRVLFIEALIIFAVLFVVTVILYVKYPEFTDHFHSVADFQSFMHAHQHESILIYIGLQIIQIVISVIPGQIVQIAGGYLYGFWLAAFLSLIGVGLGSVIAFYIARFLGQKTVRFMIGKSAMDQCSKIMDSRTSYRVIFFLYLLPGFPKDILAYAAGLSRMKLRSFIPIATIVRFPAMAVSMYIGSLLGAGSYQASAVMILLCIIVSGICITFRNRLTVLIDRYFDKTAGEKNPGIQEDQTVPEETDDFMQDPLVAGTVSEKKKEDEFLQDNDR